MHFSSRCTCKIKNDGSFVLCEACRTEVNNRRYEISINQPLEYYESLIRALGERLRR
jgi:transcription elongation factor Elf1